jgi:hypothetical protein
LSYRYMEYGEIHVDLANVLEDDDAYLASRRSTLPQL